ncbi:Lacal_2735 family protein [Reinekea forsetii]|nr:Lacal_2735 family protein [Reinekea forsetii]
MFSLFKANPTKKLKKQYEQLVSKAFQAQRNGDIRSYSLLTDEAQQVLAKIEQQTYK